MVDITTQQQNCLNMDLRGLLCIALFSSPVISFSIELTNACSVLQMVTACN